MGAYTIRSAYEKEEIIKDYLKSGTGAYTYARLHHIPPTTLKQWLRKLPVMEETEPKGTFLDITKEVKESSLVMSPGMAKSEVPQEVIPETKTNRSVKMTLPNGMTLECDVDIFTKVLGALKI